MFETNQNYGYDLYEAFPNKWVLDFRNGQAFYGTFKEVAKHMTVNLGFYIENIEEAVLIMTERDHNACHLGMFKSFIYSFQKEINCDKAS